MKMDNTILIKKGKIFDGTGVPPFEADILIKKDLIIEIGSIQSEESYIIIDGKGLALSPGFIDIHTHLDFFFPSPRHAIVLESWARQGVTTIVAGNCGYSAAPISHEKEELINTFWNFALPKDGLVYNWDSMANYFDFLETYGLAFNVAILTGHNTLRTNVMGWEARAANQDEITEMKQMLRKSLEAGSIGLSLGLYYCPGIFSHTDELIELASVLTEFGAPLVPHTRGLTSTYDKAIEEVILIAEENKIPLHLSHHAGGLGQVRANALKLIEAAKKRGLNIGHDNMPWAGGCTAVLAHFPPWILDGGIDKCINRLQDPETRKQAIEELKNFQPKWPTWENKYWTDKFFSGNTYIGGFSVNKNQKFEYMQIKDIAKYLNKDMYETLFDLVIEEKGKLFTIGYMDHPLAEKLYDDLLKDPDCSIETDVIGVDFKNPFPVSYGTFTKVLGEMARDKKLFSQEEAIRKMTSLPAQQMQLKNRGIIKTGYFADIIIFNPKTVNSRVTFSKPFEYSEGIEYVIINGKLVLEKGKYNPDTFAGRVLRNR